MICWICKRVMATTDIKNQKECSTPNQIKQTEYVCVNCGSHYVVSERWIGGPTKGDFEKNKPI